MIYAVADCNFYTDEHGLNNYVYFTNSLPDAVRYVKEKFKVEVGLHEPIVYNDDDELGERYVLIEEIKVHGE